jgi:HEAT repeat protein
MRLSLVLLLGLLAAAPTRADEPLDSPMYHDPELTPPRVVNRLPPRLPGLWVEALARPEADLKAQAAQAIARAHERGLDGLAATVGPLVRELDRPDQHPTVRLAVARALVVLDAKDAAAALARAAADPELCEIVDPALARWDYLPARAVWRERINQSPARRGTLLAIRALGVVRDPEAAPRLRELVLDRGAPAPARLEAAGALAEIRTAGGEADARALAADASPRGLTDRLAAASLLRRHASDEAVKLLLVLGRDPEPAVASVALARLVELDPGNVLPLLDGVTASPDANVRGFGVEVLHRRPSAAHVRLLGDRLSDPHPAVRGRARAALLELGAQAEWKEAVIGEGARALAGRDWRGLEQATLLLAGLDHKPAAGRLAELLRHDRIEVYVTAAWGLRRLGVSDTLSAVLAYVAERYPSLFAAGPGAAGPTEAAIDNQLSQLAQFLGQARHRPADAVLRRLFAQTTPPANQSGPESRAAAAYALGLIHQGAGPPDLIRGMVGRLSAVGPLDQEDNRVRRMAAVALGRMKADAALAKLREFYRGREPALYPVNKTLYEVNDACGWAVEQLTGEKVPPPGTAEVFARDWFLYPLD